MTRPFALRLLAKIITESAQLTLREGSAEDGSSVMGLATGDGQIEICAFRDLTGSVFGTIQGVAGKRHVDIKTFAPGSALSTAEIISTFNIVLAVRGGTVEVEDRLQQLAERASSGGE